MNNAGQKLKILGLFLIIIFSGFESQSQTKSKATYKSSSKTHSHKSSNGVSSTDLEYKGKIVFTDDDLDVKSISPGGFINFSKRTFGTKRSIVLEGNANGTINRTYYEGSREMPFDPDGREFMEVMIPEIIRTTGLGADSRVARFYKQGGITEVLHEIDEISSNYVSVMYYDATMNISGLSDADKVKIIQHAGDNLSSSYELSKFLINNREILLSSNATSVAFVEAASEISSNYDQARVYKSVLTSDVSPATVALVIDGSQNISSNYEKSGILQVALGYDLDDASIELVLEAVEDMSSSYEQSKVITALIKEQELNEISTERLLLAATEISSDYEKAKVAGALISTKDLTTQEIKLLTAYSSEISSDYEQSKLLQTLLKSQSMNEESIEMIIIMSDEVSSSYEQSKILTQVLSSPNFKGANFDSMIEAASDISSDYETSKVLMQLIKHDNLTDKNYVNLINAVADISSNYERAKLLAAIGPNLPDDKATQDAFFEAAEGLSNTDYGTVMRAMRR